MLLQSSIQDGNMPSIFCCIYIKRHMYLNKSRHASMGKKEPVRGILAPCTAHAPTRPCMYTCSRQGVHEEHLYSYLHPACCLFPSPSMILHCMAACMTPKETRYVCVTTQESQHANRTLHSLICTSFLCCVYLLSSVDHIYPV